MNISLNDRRKKTEDNKKVMKTFRFSPQAILNIDMLKKKNGISEAAILENLLAKEING